MTKRLNIKIGDRFGRLTVVKELDPHQGKKRDRLFELACTCGNIVSVKLRMLRAAQTTSCGCYRRERLSKNKFGIIHNCSNHALYSTWSGIIQRCYNEKHTSFHNYGGRGIEVCAAWKDNPINFFSWAIENGWKEGLQTDRIDNNGNYSPDNCRFVTSKTNCRNTRKNRSIEYQGKIYTIGEAVEILSVVPGSTLIYRLNNNWSIEKALFTPSRQGKGKIKYD